MKIGIFGGSFNPPHKMHENIAQYLIDGKWVDKVIFVPTGSKYKYKNNLISDEHRLNMLKLIASENVDFMVSDNELKDHVVYTCDTLDYFKSIYSDDSIYFICGLDNLSYIDSWKNSEYLLSNYRFLVIRRKGDDLDEVLMRLEKYRDRIEVVDIKEMDISSTIVREELREHSTSEHLNHKVLQYIQDHNLYKEG